MNWKEMTTLQRNALIAENLFGWEWIPYDFYDCSLKDQIWLLPDGQSVADLKPGEWTWYLEEEAIFPEGSLFPLEHKDKHILVDMPNYIGSMDTAMSVVRQMNESDSPDYPDFATYARFIEELEKIVGSNLIFDLFYCDLEGDHLTPERICLAALRARGVTV